MKLRENIPEDVLNTFSKLTGFATENIKFIRGFLCPASTYALTHMNVDMTTSMPEDNIEDFNKYAMTCLKDLDSLEWSILDGVHMLAKTPNSENFQSVLFMHVQTQNLNVYLVYQRIHGINYGWMVCINMINLLKVSRFKL